MPVPRLRQLAVRGRSGCRRDAAVLKVIYAFGLRRTETAMLDLLDLRAKPPLPAYGRCGGQREGSVRQGSGRVGA